VAFLPDHYELQEQLYKEMRGRIQEADQSVPERLHGWFYYSRTEEGQQYKVGGLTCMGRRVLNFGFWAPLESFRLR
jgi:oligopeptidase B